MGIMKDLWVDEHERIGEDYACGIIDWDTALARLLGMGFLIDEAREELDALEDDRAAAE